MHLAAPIFLAYGDTSIWDIVVFVIAGVIWLGSQMSAAKKQKERKARDAQTPGSPSSANSRSGDGDSPTPNELAEIFKRLGADIPATPPPPPPPPQPPRPPARPAPSMTRPAPVPAPHLGRKPPQPIMRSHAAARIQPALAKRLAQAKREAEEAATQAEAVRYSEEQIANAVVQGVMSRAGETRALDTATRHTGAILPRLYAMSMRLAPLPTLPMPGLDRTHHVNVPMRTRLHTRREVRDALIAQTFLQPPKSLAR